MSSCQAQSSGQVSQQSPCAAAACRQSGTIRCLLDLELIERTTVQRAELDELEERTVKRRTEVRFRLDGLTVAEHALERVSKQYTPLPASAAPAPGRWARTVPLIALRAPGLQEAKHPPDSPRISPSDGHRARAASATQEPADSHQGPHRPGPRLGRVRVIGDGGSRFRPMSESMA